MKDYFAGVTDIQTLRKCYRALLKKLHPDNGGNVADMQELNRQYDALFDRLSHEKKADGHSYSYEENEQFKAILNAVIGFNMTVEVIGSWVWCFDCYQYKDQLKALGFTWCSKKKAWVWHDEPYHRHHKKEIPLSQIKAKYGCQTVRKQAFQYSID